MRHERRLNALARGRLRAHRGAERRCTGAREAVPGPRPSVELSQRLVTILAPVLG